MRRVTRPRIIRARVEEDLYREIATRVDASSESAVVRRALRVYVAIARVLEDDRR